jgi:two-component system response regulator FixJ
MAASLRSEPQHHRMNAKRPVITHIVDDDGAVREVLAQVLSRWTSRIELHATAESFRTAYDAAQPACLLLDVALPGMSGLDLLDDLRRRAIMLPTLVLSASADVERVIASMHLGAVGFLQKPPEPLRLLDYVQRMVAAAGPMAHERRVLDFLVGTARTLTPRERQVFERVAAGRSTKQVAHELGMSIRTAHIHRTNVMVKFDVETLIDLVRCHDRLRAAGQMPGDG